MGTIATMITSATMTQLRTLDRLEAKYCQHLKLIDDMILEAVKDDKTHCKVIMLELDKDYRGISRTMGDDLVWLLQYSGYKAEYNRQSYLKYDSIIINW